MIVFIAARAEKGLRVSDLLCFPVCACMISIDHMGIWYEGCTYEDGFYGC